MFTRGWKNARLAGTAGVATIGLLVACGNDLKPVAETMPITTPKSTSTVPTAASTPTSTPPEATPTPKPSNTVTLTTKPSSTPTPKPSLPPK